MSTASTLILDVGEQVAVVLPHLGSVPATVEAMTGDSITVVLLVPDERVVRLDGRQVAVEKVSGRGIQRFSGAVSVGGTRGELLTVALHGEAERVQRREFVRVPAVVPVMVLSLEPGVTAGTTSTINVSGGGVLVRDLWTLPLGIDVRLEIRIEADSEPIHALGRVVRFVSETEKGIRIDDLARLDEDRLVKFIRERERAELRLARGR